MNQVIQVSSVMSRSVFTVKSDDTVEHAKQVFYQHEIHHLPVVKGTVVVGMLSDRDLKLALAVIGTTRSPATLKVSDICVLEPYTCEEETALVDVLSTMHSRRIGSAVVTKDGRPVGIFTASDCVRLLGDSLR